MLPQSHCARGLTAEVTALGDALRIDWPREFTTESSVMG